MSGKPCNIATPAKNHVFVDFENTHHLDLSMLGCDGFCFTLLLGAMQTKLEAAVVEKLIEHAESVQFVRLTSSGRNAVDFALAYYLGRAALSDPTARFHIISKDSGFDPLIEHLRSRSIHVERHTDFTGLASLRRGPVETLHQGLCQRALELLNKNVKSRPRRRKTLESYLQAMLGKPTTENDISAVIESLRKAGHIAIGEKETVAYRD